jgi:hypothetical protein
MNLTITPQISFSVTNLLFLLVPLSKAVYDVYFTQFQRKEVVHSKSLTYAMMLGCVFAVVDWRFSQVSYFVQVVPLTTTTFYLIFDYLRNKFALKPFFYMDINPSSDPEEDSWVDSVVYKYLPNPYLWLTLKIIMFLSSVYFYYFVSFM